MTHVANISYKAMVRDEFKLGSLFLSKKALVCNQLQTNTDSLVDTKVRNDIIPSVSTFKCHTACDFIIM